MGIKQEDAFGWIHSSMFTSKLEASLGKCYRTPSRLSPVRSIFCLPQWGKGDRVAVDEASCGTTGRHLRLDPCTLPLVSKLPDGCGADANPFRA